LSIKGMTENRDILITLGFIAQGLLLLGIRPIASYEARVISAPA
jgi:hypothetical protein